MDLVLFGNELLNDKLKNFLFEKIFLVRVAVFSILRGNQCGHLLLDKNKQLYTYK